MIDKLYLFFCICLVILLLYIYYCYKKLQIFKDFNEWAELVLMKSDYEIFKKYDNPSVLTAIKYNGVIE